MRHGLPTPNYDNLLVADWQEYNESLTATVQATDRPMWAEVEVPDPLVASYRAIRVCIHDVVDGKKKHEANLALYEELVQHFFDSIDEERLCREFRKSPLEMPDRQMEG
jgi:hypothetical protein